MPRNRSMVFIDGNNWYHGLKSIGVDSGDLDYPRMASKLLIGRDLVGIRYYVGQVRGDLRRIRAQQRFLRRIERQGVHVELGRIELNWLHPERNPMSVDLLAAMAEWSESIPAAARKRLEAVAARRVPQHVEKQVDVRIAVDLVGQAHRDEFDTAYLLTADGDFVPAVQEVRHLGKSVFVASAQFGSRLAEAASTFIRLPRSWFDGLSST